MINVLLNIIECINIVVYMTNVHVSSNMEGNMSIEGGTNIKVIMQRGHTRKYIEEISYTVRLVLVVH